MHELLIVTVVLAIVFDMTNGWHDTANAIATVVSTRVLAPLTAVLLAASMNIIGAFFSTAVAKTIGKGVVDPNAVIEAVVCSALIAAILWNYITIKMGLPVSSSHALIGSLIGSSVAYKGIGILNLKGLEMIFLSLLTAPILGLGFGYLFMKLILTFFGYYPSGTLNKVFGRLQLVSSGFMALSHGSNDAQKVMGIITLALVSGGYINTLEVPFWVIVTCALAMGLGTALGGWKIIKTLGVSILKLEPIHGFAAETSATMVIMGATHLGLPVSTTHVISSTIMGAGATKRLSAVRWGIAGKIVMAWVFTLPFCAILAWLIYKGLSLFL